MSDSNPMGMDTTLFQLQASRSDGTVSSAKAKMEGGDPNNADLEKASSQFESLLLSFMIREMRATVPESGLFPPSMAQDIFTSMLDEKYADAMAERGGIGLARILVDQLSDVKTDK
jgi:flagellar protein FlgJ